MAMIKCPECGNMVSDKAPACIHCGTPLQINKSVKIKIPRFVTGMMSQKASEAELKCNGKILWKGFSDQVASIEIEEPNANVNILIKKAYTGHPFPFFRDFTIKGFVMQGKKYEVRNARASLVFGDPTKSDWVLSEVDVIDSGI